jgi:hypothetical protein
MVATMSLLVMLAALVVFGAAHFVAHGLARHFTARALGVRGTRPVFEIADAEAYASSPRSRRVVAAAAGPLANYALCALGFLAAFLVGGQIEVTRTVRVLPGGPAAEAGLRDGDRIVGIDGKRISDFAEVPAAVKASGAGELVLEVERGGKTLRLPVTIRGGRIGVMAMSERRAADPGAAARLAIPMPAGIMYRTFFGTTTPHFSGPVGIIRATGVESDVRAGVAGVLTTLASYASRLWPVSIVVAVVANRARRRQRPTAVRSAS